MEIGKTIKILEAGFDEYWLQDQIYENPSILTLGDLEAVAREKVQSSGGRLDILLKDPEDNAMYEVEIMLGHTDESHIIRAIEYWDIERRKWPKRQHTCVLVAEVINRRFFNVIQLLSNSIPIVAIQANVIDASGTKVLHFTKILDLYEEPISDESEMDGEYDEAYWKKNFPWAVASAYKIKDFLKSEFPDSYLGFVKNYISVGFQGKNRFWLRARGNAETRVSTWFDDPDLAQAGGKLDAEHISYSSRKNEVVFRVDDVSIAKMPSVFVELARIMKRY